MDEIRRRALEYLKAQPETAKSIDITEFSKLIEELAVHQVALDMQNQELVEAHSQLTASRERYRALFDHAPVGYAVVDRQGIIRDSNLAGCEILSRKRSNLIGCRLSSLLRSTDEAALHTHLERVFTGMSTEEMACLVLVDGGHVKPCILRSVMVPADALVKQDQCVIAISDVSVQKEAEAAMAQAQALAETANRAKSDFLTNMTHELRTPLTGIIGSAELIAETSLTDLQRGHVERMLKSGSLALDLVSSILDLAKIESGNMTTESVPFQPRPMVAGALAVIEQQARAKGVETVWTVADEVPEWIVGDPNHTKQILVNLLGNALKFTQEGSVTVELREGATPSPAKSLILAVRDTGIGIAPEKQKIVFDKFAQADMSLARKYGGSGLGLAIVRELVELIGGQIWVESQAGLGTCFYVRIPLRLPASTPETTPSLPATADAEQREHALSILLAEDTIDTCAIVEAVVDRTAHRLVVTENGEQAVAAFEAEEFDLVLMDLQMPEMDGFAATRLIRTHEVANGRRPARIIALTAHARADVLAQTAAAGFDGHILKPFHVEELDELFRNVIATQTLPATQP